MIDQEDADLILIGWPEGGAVMLLVGLLVYGFFQYQACQNEKACAARACPNGQSAQLLAEQCLCVERAP